MFKVNCLFSVMESLHIFDFSYFAPYLGKLSFGALAGFAVGFAIKKVSKVVLIILGVCFILSQVAAYYGYIKIDWFRIQEVTNPSLTSQSLSESWHRFVTILTFSIPFTAAFIPMLLLGLKKG